MHRSSLARITMSTAMTIAITFPLLVWSGQVVDAANPLCAAVCVCENLDEEGVVKADCSRVDLSIVPPLDDWPSNITDMDLSSNLISTLDMELAHNTLEVLDLSYNKISSVAQNAFGALYKLRYLNLANNVIKEFNENGFYGLEHLKSLNLSSNSLTILPDLLFYHFIGLQELSLADNPLKHIVPIHFNRMINLRWLDLSDTELYSLPPNIFHTTGQLEFLDLSANDFYEVPTDALRSAQSLRHLRLSENPINSLEKKSFIKLTKLQVLELNSMDHLERVSSNTFSDLTELVVLEMKYNRFLSSIDAGAFSGLFNSSRPVLQEMDLEGNQIRSLDRDTVACAKMRKFNVQNNPWTCDCDMKWIKQCQIQKIYAADLTCSSPEKLKNALIYSLSEDDFVCDYSQSRESAAAHHHDKVVQGISVAIGVGLLAALAISIALVFKWQKIKSWYKYKSRGPGAVYYVRARNNPGPIVNQA